MIYSLIYILFCERFIFWTDGKSLYDSIVNTHNSRTNPDSSQANGNPPPPPTLAPAIASSQGTNIQSCCAFLWSCLPLPPHVTDVTPRLLPCWLTPTLALSSREHATVPKNPPSSSPSLSHSSAHNRPQMKLPSPPPLHPGAVCPPLHWILPPTSTYLELPLTPSFSELRPPVVHSLVPLRLTSPSTRWSCRTSPPPPHRLTIEETLPRQTDTAASLWTCRYGATPPPSPCRAGSSSTARAHGEDLIMQGPPATVPPLTVTTPECASWDGQATFGSRLG
jgi:hypothetical protein